MEKRNRGCVVGVFGLPRMHSCVKQEKTGECMDKKGVMVEEWKARKKEWKKKRWKKGKKEKVVLGKVLLFLFTIKICGLVPESQLAACHPPSLKRERWGLSHYGLKPGRVE